MRIVRDVRVSSVGRKLWCSVSVQGVSNGATRAGAYAQEGMLQVRQHFCWDALRRLSTLKGCWLYYLWRWRGLWGNVPLVPRQLGSPLRRVLCFGQCRIAHAQTELRVFIWIFHP